MKYFIPTYDEAMLIVNSNPEMVFLCTEREIDGYRIVIFSYKLAWYKEFIEPIEGNEYIKAHEVRGLTFIFNKDGSLFKRYILLNKFFNVNQTDETSIDNLRNKKIKSITDKVDGSIASFIKLPNGKVLGKSKNSFRSDQALIINEIYNTNADLKRFVDYTLDNDIVAIFEYVSPKNPIVLDYSESKLILLKLRNNKTGEYIDIDSIDKQLLENVDIVKNEELNSLESILELYKTIENKEGCVIQFDDDYLVKAKTDWYYRKHRLLTESLAYENNIIDIILNDKLDDILSRLDNSEVDRKKREFILDIKDKLYKYISNKMKILNEKIVSFDGDRKLYYEKIKNDKDSSLLLRLASGHDIYEVIKSEILKKTYFLKKAQKFIHEISK